MEFLNRCNGFKMKVVTFGPKALDIFNAELVAARHAFEKMLLDIDPGRDQYHLSTRFYDGNTVLNRIQSAVSSEQEFLEDTKAWILDALRDCAGADHWYTFEKEW